MDLRRRGKGNCYLHCLAPTRKPTLWLFGLNPRFPRQRVALTGWNRIILEHPGTPSGSECLHDAILSTDEDYSVSTLDHCTYYLYIFHDFLYAYVDVTVSFSTVLYTYLPVA